MTWRTPDN